MIYGFHADKLVCIERVYSVTRKTVWQVADSSNIMLLIIEGKCRIELAGQSAVVSEKTVDGERACLVYIPRGRHMIRFG